MVTVDDVPLPPARDRVESDGTAVLHMQSVGAASDGDELFPDFVYGGWWHIGLHDFDAFAAAMEAAAAAEPRPRHPQAFWIGNVEMSPSRAALVALSAAHPERVDARGIRWQHARGNVSEATGARAATDAWVTLQDHVRWRYLVDLEGTGWSGRLKLLPFAGRPLLVQERPYWDWASSRLVAHEHYVPLRSDLSDVLAQLDALDADPPRAQRIADAAAQVARERLGFGAAVAHAVNLTSRRLRALLPAAAEARAAALAKAAPQKRQGRWEQRLRSAKVTSAGEAAPASAPMPAVLSAAAEALAAGASEAAAREAPWAGEAEADDGDDAAAEALQRRAEADARAAAAAVHAAAARPTAYDCAGHVVRVHPISNSLPDHLFVAAVPRKTVGFAENMPGNASTYVFRTEATYLGHYRRSLYGVTRKKTGWDSGRHLEIMASGAVPFFVDIDALPPQTLSFYPSELIRRAMALPGVRARAGGADDGRWYLNRENFWVGAGFNVSEYREVAAAILAHARAHLSASAMAAHVLRTMGVDDAAARPLLFVTHCSEDFTADSLLFGFQRLLGADAVVDASFDTEGMEHPWCDDAHRGERRKPLLYAAADNDPGTNRFSLRGSHADSPRISRERLEERLAAREFGAVIFGSASRTTSLLPIVREHYPPSRVAFVYGEDMPYPLNAGWPYEGIQRPVGSRAPLPSTADASRWGVVFQRELYEAAADAPHRHQTLMVPGVADVVERGWREPLSTGACIDD